MRRREVIQVFHKALLHLAVGECQGVDIEAAVITLQGEVPTLVEEGQGVLVHDVDAVERVGGEFLLCHLRQREARLLQLIDEE